VRQLEEQLAKPRLEVDISLEKTTPVPSIEARELAAQIEGDASPYAQALKAIAEGDSQKADELLDETQEYLDGIQREKDKAQAKIYTARIQNSTYAGRYQDALQYCEQLKPLAGNDALILNEIAFVYYRNARYDKAEPLMKRAIEIFEKSLGEDHPSVATALNNLAQLYKDTNRLAEAEPLMKRVVEILENSDGEPMPNYAGALNNLAGLYQRTGRLTEAEPLLKQALAIDEANFGKNHPNVAIRLNNLAQLYQETERLADAEPLMKRTVEIFEKSLGENHPNVATALNNLAWLYKVTSRFVEAEALMRRALAIDETSLGKDHPKVAIQLNNLALLYKDTNRLAEAESLMGRHLVIFLEFTRRTGHPHLHLKTAIDNYIRLLMGMGHSKEEAIAKIESIAPEMFEKTEGGMDSASSAE
jgi:tetratricopeptide (TPR) repeat protein